MRPGFSDEKVLKSKAKENLNSGMANLRRWWSKKYELPPNHPLFENQPRAEVELEMFEDFLIRKEEIEDELYGDDRKEESHSDSLVRQLNAIRKFLGEEETSYDPLADKWERELLEGKTPDLNEPVM